MTTLPPAEAGLSIGDAARALGVSVHTLRYYERDGLLNVPRTVGPGTEGRHLQVSRHAQRRYGPDELDLLRFLLALRGTGMPMNLIRRYMALVRQGEQTVPERRALLLAHRQAVAAQIAGLEDNLKAVDIKIGKYDRLGSCAPDGPAQAEGVN